VLRLHRSTGPSGQGLTGRRPHLASGTHTDFGDLAGLQAVLQASVERGLTHS
jgi:hypothetical protein